MKMNMLFLIVIAASLAQTCSAKPPNIVFIVADDLGWNDVSWHNPAMKTPNIESLARNGIILNQSYVQPMCSPSRSAWLSGYYPYHTGMQHTVIMAYAGYGLPLNITTLPQKLKQAGYRTHIVGKWHQGFCNWRYTPTYRGFDSFLGYYIGAEDHYTHEVYDGRWNGLDFRFNEKPLRTFNGTYGNYIFTQRARDIIKTHKQEEGPLFLYLPFQNVHDPLQVPKQYEDLYPNIRNRPRRIFSGMVTILDEAIGNVTSALKETGMYDDTIIIFTTDNGGQVRNSGNNWPLRGSKTTLWEGGTRGVAFVHSPLLKKTGFVYDGMIHAADWFPSILSIASVKTDDAIDGVDFWSNVINNKTSSRNSFVYNIDDIFKNGAIRDGNYKLIVGNPGHLNDWYPVPKLSNHQPGLPLCKDTEGECAELPDEAIPRSWPFDKVKLFDLSKDPTEHYDLSKSNPTKVQEMLKTFQNHLKSLVPGNPNKRDPKANPAFFNNTWSPGWC
ncbi:arylsulfatase B-like [Tubulanus polymorphus]|uniref:arylsulfatase B-like n=1 Tax=Tubulanus polymorphus TaxID=672921 RepID=UPI003DA4A011